MLGHLSICTVIYFPLKTASIAPPTKASEFTLERTKKFSERRSEETLQPSGFICLKKKIILAEGSYFQEGLETVF